MDQEKAATRTLLRSGERKVKLPPCRHVTLKRKNHAPSTQGQLTGLKGGDRRTIGTVICLMPTERPQHADQGSTRLYTS